MDVTPGALSTARDTHTATRLNTGQVLVAGGEDSWCMPLASSQLYNPGAGTWSSKGDLSSPRNGHTATQLNNGQVLVAGGYNISSTGVLYALNSADLYQAPGALPWQMMLLGD